MMQKSKVPAIRFAGFTDEWEERKLGKLFKYEQPSPYIVKSTEYYDHFNTPVLTAGQNFLLGYTDEIFGIKIATKDNPIIIFDDFTTLSRYVDFSFKIKSSAIKLLTLCKICDDIYLAFNVLQNIKYIPVNHERHWISIFSKFDILIPVKAKEQHRIGTFFRQLDDLISLQQRKYKKLTNIKRAMLEKMFPTNGAFIPEIRFKGFTDEWEERKLGDIGKITMGQSPLGSTYCDKPNTYILVQGNADLQNGWVKPKVWTTQMTKKASVGDFIMSVRAPVGTVGKTAYDIVIGRGVAAIKGNEFLYQLLVRMNYVGFWKALSCGSTFKSINYEYIKNAELSIPSATEQHCIGTFFRQLDDLISLQRHKLEQIKNIKRAYLDKMFV